MILLSIYYCIQAIKARRTQRRRKRKTATIERAAAPPKAKTQAQIEQDQRAAEKRRLEYKQAEIDAPFYADQLNQYMRMHRDALKLYDAAQKEVDTDNQLNQYGAVVSIKTYQRHIRERDRQQKMVLQYERMIHSAQQKLDKANRILYSYDRERGY